jgi:hypothetical protein
MRNSWLTIDDQRVRWLFVLLGPVASSTSQADASAQVTDVPGYWEFGVGNSDALVSTEAAKLGSEDIETEADLIDSLLDAFAPYRYQEAVLVTPTRDTLGQLRRVLSRTPVEPATLRGFTQIDLEAMLDTYFGQSLRDREIDPESWTPPRITEDGNATVVSTGTVERLWDVWQELYRLIPAEDLNGGPL